MGAKVLPIRGPGRPAAVEPDVANTGLKQALGRDLTLMFRPLGVEACRAFAMDLESLECRAAWLISERGEVTDDSPERSLDSAFPGATSVIGQLVALDREETVVHKLGPRRWAFAWRVDRRSGVVAETRYRDVREPPSEIDAALIRLICDAGMRMGESSAAAPQEGHRELDWPAPEAPPSTPPAAQPASSSIWLGAALLAIIGLLSLWIGLVTIPQARDSAAALQAQVAQLRTMSEQTMQRNLVTTLAGGDYGEVQEVLTGYATLGYFHGAIVTNPRHKVVSLAGQAPGLTVGSEVPDDVARGARSIDLALGSESLGQLFLLSPPGGLPPDQVEGLGPLRIFVALTFALAAAGAGLLAWTRRQRRALDDPAD